RTPGSEGGDGNRRSLPLSFAYIRLHGPSLAAYAGCYTTEALRTWAARIRTWDLRAVYVYFDNDQAAYATHNAVELMKILGLSNP
ncbi:DUF72 domain-containing protein, partial [Acidithiobacillus sp.]|uniref:DUF72 domain-containing protein n=1 Tax=Acidithiobacillus sp. TaxID=1872118 RepID=UPI0025C168FD